MNSYYTKDTWKDPEKLKLLKDWWENTRWTAVEIGQKLGVSNGAVVGKCRRMGFKRPGDWYDKRGRRKNLEQAMAAIKKRRIPKFITITSKDPYQGRVYG